MSTTTFDEIFAKLVDLGIEEDIACQAASIAVEKLPDGRTRWDHAVELAFQFSD